MKIGTPQEWMISQYMYHVSITYITGINGNIVWIKSFCIFNASACTNVTNVVKIKFPLKCTNAQCIGSVTNKTSLRLPSKSYNCSIILHLKWTIVGS